MDILSKACSAIGNGLEKVGRSAGRELERVANEHVEHITEDFDSIATAIDNGGFVGGAVQALDVFSPGHQIANGLDELNVIPEDPALKELISGGVNLTTGGPWQLLALKDLADSIGAIKGSTQTQAPSQAAPAPSEATRTADGYPRCDHSNGSVRESQSLTLRELGDVLCALREMREARRCYCEQHPEAPVPTDGHYTIDEILNHPTMSTGEVCCRVVGVIVHEHPEALEEVGQCTGTRPPASTSEPAANAEASAPKSNTEAGQAVFGIFGQVASFLGPLLGNPMVGTALGALLMATPLAPIAPFLPVILPLAGSALTMLGGAATQVSQGQDPTLSPGAGPSPDMLGGLLQAIPAMLGAAPGAAPAPVPAA